MMWAYRCGFSMLVAASAAFWLAQPRTAFAALQTEVGPQPSREFHLIPQEQPSLGNGQRIDALLRRPVVIKSERARRHIRERFVRAAVLCGAGLLGLLLLGVRIYGRRHGKSAT